jgi:hypothetical protein
MGSPLYSPLREYVVQKTWVLRYAQFKVPGSKFEVAP